MADKVVKGYWDCPYCSSREIDGLVDFCPNCGVHKPKDVKYYLKGNVTTNTTYSKSKVQDSDVLSEKELEKAGISKEECDGKYKEWVCDFCGSLNNWADNVCSSCGSQKDESDTLYGGEKKSGEEPAEQQHTANSQDKEQLSVWDKIKSFFVKNRKVAAIVTVIIAVLSVMFFPYKKVVTVKSFAWERNISLEEYRTVQESDWNVPEGGRVYDEKTEIKSYVSVVDHYETVWETKTREVFDHNETSTTYSDNGNGTFTEHTTTTPVYRTETYQESHEEPVYRQDPVYATKYYYDIDKWVDTGNDYPSSGKDHKPYWNEDYKPMADNIRDTDRSETYTVKLDNGKTQEKSYSEWKNMKIGDTKEQTTCLVGIVYSEKDLGK
ncbi:MAG: hypothetical protein EGR89_06750 [[Eubacterium] rectale]|nr:hypothetical protein [Agathobacter rectalis]